MTVNLLLQCVDRIFSFKVILPPHLRVFSSSQYEILFSESVSFLSIHLATSNLCSASTDVSVTLGFSCKLLYTTLCDLPFWASYVSKLH